MQSSDNQGQRRPINDREEHHKIIFEESLDSYALAAKMKKSSERSRSLSLKLGFRENGRNNENVSKSRVRILE